jgi:dephospho-CoA kinase
MKKIAIGITGGIGSGKSTVSNIISENGHQVLNADNIAKKIMNTDAVIASKIIESFGGECFKDHKLNTKYLAEKVFNLPDRMRKLNEIIHPPTIDYIKKEIKSLHKNNNIVFVEAALIFEAKMEDLFEYILLVTAEEDLRIKRVLARDLETISEIRSRILNQIPEEQKRGRSHFVIENNSSMEELNSKVNFFLKIFNSLPNFS